MIAATVSAEAPGHGLLALTGLPENGSTAPPSSTVLNHVVSLSCWLSARSPVVIAKPSLARLPPARSSLVRLRFMLRTVWSKTWSPNASCGRQEELLAPPAGSTKSTRAGDISSAICGSVSWPKKASERRVLERRASARRPGGRRSPWSSPERVRRLVKAPEPSGRIVSSVVDFPAGSARATGALSRQISAPSNRERADMPRSCHTGDDPSASWVPGLW